MGFLAFLLACISSVAGSAELEPVESRARALEPATVVATSGEEAGGAAGGGTFSACQCPHSAFQVNMLVHYGFLPDSLLDKWFEIHGRVEGLAPGIEISWERGGFNMSGLFETLLVLTPDQVWLEKDKTANDAVWVEQDLKLMAVSLVFSYEFGLPWRLTLVPGIGYGIVYRKGEIWQFPTIGTADTPVTERVVAPGEKGSVYVMPKSFQQGDLSLRLRYRPTHRWLFSADLGFHLFVYTGLSAGLRF